MARKPRPLALAVAAVALLSGCLGAPQPAEAPPSGDAPGGPAPGTPGAAPGDAAAGEPYRGEGLVFLPPSEGQQRAVTELPFPVNGTGWTARAQLRLGMRMLAEVPPVGADVEALLVDASGATLSEARMAYPQVEATLLTADLSPGPHALVLRSYGGSDEEASGMYVAWALEAAPAAPS